MTDEADQDRVSQLLGARDLIRECEEMLRGERQQFTGMEEYLRQRLEFWQARFDSLDLRRSDRREGERRHSRRVGHGRRRHHDRRHPAT